MICGRPSCAFLQHDDLGLVLKKQCQPTETKQNN